MMYELDKRFFDEDGSVNVEAAMAAGRKAHSHHLFEGFGLVGDTAVQLFRCARRAAASLYTRISSSRAFQSKTA